MNKYEEQLGMNVATATARLRKNLLYSLAKRLGLLDCVRCEKHIEIDDFSIDHVEAWRGKDAALFWDLDNVGFTHLHCNSTAAKRRKTHCKRGHEFTEENTRRNKHGHRACRACGLIRWHADRGRSSRNRRIRRLRKNGHSLREVARKVGISHVTVWNVCRGQEGRR